MNQEKYLFTSESVTEGHPDKIADQISDAILDEILIQDPRARVACEVMVSTGLVFVAGEITTSAMVDYPDVVRRTVREIGYNSPELGFDASTCAVLISLDKQSPDIAMGVDKSQEVRFGLAKDQYDEIGAGDSGMVVGYACNETHALMPLPIFLAHQLSFALAEERKSGRLPYLRPDGKTQVTVEYRKNAPYRVHTIIVSTQHDEPISHDYERLQSDIKERVIKRVIPPELLDENTLIYVNPTGKFVIGGPVADVGLTGRKIIQDTYGGRGAHGGGCFSGKDPTKVDRSGAYMARYIAKNVVAAGLAEVFEIQVSYAIGVARPVSVFIDSFGTAKVPEEKIQKAILKVFDLRPKAIIDQLNLLRPIYRKTAAYGHFGRTDVLFPWEKTDKTEDLLREVKNL
ncbi:MAG: methionine adenosyltransferase [Caldiserica bacterium]|jgi:S-adenosylmethionine synthetase|nr:methionine adenosyltransferase [Caldisericota bacterium]MDH7562138.1 methionine adenosyltransferase [Caldisericota bacterium]